MTRIHLFLACALAGLFTPVRATVAGPTGADPRDPPEAERRASREQLIEEVRRSWRMPDAASPPQPAADAGEKEEPTPLARKLDSLVLPTVTFNNLELSRVVQTLSALSEEHDAAGASARGVNVVLLDPGGENPRVSLTVRNLSLRRVLDLVTASVGFDYETQADAVLVRPAGEKGNRLRTEVFSVSRATVLRMTGQPAASVVASPGPTAAPAKTKPGDVVQETEALKRFFQLAGVTFEGTPGSALAYDGAAVIVTQTPRNLERVRTLLRRYREIRQVEIEAKFMEVSEGALEELGVQWSASHRSGTVLDPVTGQPALNSDGTVRRRYDEFYNSNNRALSSAFDQTQQQRQISITGEPSIPVVPPRPPNGAQLGAGAAPLVDLRTTLGEFDVNAIVRALSQQTGSDLLSAPKVTVLSGSTAVITVAQELRYPQRYTDTQSQVGVSGTNGSGSAGVTITSGTPQDFATRNIGVELRVTPTVEDDDRGISLELNPKVTEFEGFVEYGGTNVAISEGRTVTVPAGFFQPVFSVREVETRVTLWDGATLIMGGLTREEVKKVKDKVPVLGDIPLLGKLFRSRGESSQKRNLLIFVTARLVDPAGAPRQRSGSP